MARTEATPRPAERGKPSIVMAAGGDWRMTREGLRAALRDHGASSVLVRFQGGRHGYRLRSYRREPENRPLPADLTGRLRALAQATIEESLPRETHHRGKRGTVTWTLASDRFVIGY